MTTAEILCLAVLNLGLPRAEYACEYMETVADAAEMNGIRPELIVAVIHNESRWNPKVVSSAKACGLMQIIPKFTGNKKTGVKRWTCKQLFEPHRNINVGAKILSYWINKKYAYTKRKEKIGVCSYLAGYRCRGPKPNKAGMRYSRRVRRLANKIKKEIERIENCILLKNSDEYDEFGCDC